MRHHVSFKPGRMLEIGSQDINGSIRSSFTDATEYIGIDMQEGLGVDVVMNASAMLAHFGAASFDTIACCEMLEHDVDFLNTVEDIHEMVTDGGYLVITTPTFGFPLHRFPKDYWRFGEDAYREVFFKDYQILNLMFLDDVAAPRGTIACVGRKL